MSERRYDNVTVTSLEDGTTIEGHDAVNAYFEKEQALLDAHGSTITFQVFRLNLDAKSLGELQGPKLAELKVDGDFVSGSDTVRDVKQNLLPLLEKRGLQPSAGEQVSFFFSNRPMHDSKLFYADHFMMLPVWVQVCMHASTFAELDETIRKLLASRRQG